MSPGPGLGWGVGLNLGLILGLVGSIVLILTLVLGRIVMIRRCYSNPKSWSKFNARSGSGYYSWSWSGKVSTFRSKFKAWSRSVSMSGKDNK